MTRSLRFVSLAACFLPLGTPSSHDLNLHTTKTHWPIIQKVPDHLVEILRVPRQSNFIHCVPKALLYPFPYGTLFTIDNSGLYPWVKVELHSSDALATYPPAKTAQNYGTTTLCGNRLERVLILQGRFRAAVMAQIH